MTPIVAIRPEPGLTATLEAAAEAGLAVTGEALSQVEPVEWQVPDPKEFDGLLIGSANVFRLGGEALDMLRCLPVLAVGDTTAEAARDAGFDVEVTGSGGLQSVLDALPVRKRRLLRLSGEDNVALQPPSHVDLREIATYRIAPLAMSARLANTLSEGAIVLLHSAGSAHHFAEECDRFSIDRSVIRLAALGPRILSAAGEGWGEMRPSNEPNDAALLALARDMCN